MSGLSELPPELIALLCTFLPYPSLKAFRCTSKAYAVIGEKHLFDGFEFKLSPSHHRLYQLEQLAAHPTIAPRLKCLAYESGVQLEYADFRYWQANVYQRLSNARSNGLASKSMSKDEYAQFHAALQARFTTDMPLKYDLYRWHLDCEASMMAETHVRKMLFRIMNTLSKSNPHLKLKTVMSEPQIELQDLENFNQEEYSYDMTKHPDPRQRVFRRRTNSLAHFTHFLEASALSDLQVTDMCAVDLPHQLLTVDDSHTWNVLSQTFHSLQVLDIKIGTFPHSDWLSRGGLAEVYFGGRNMAANRLARLLNAPSNLSSLRLEFPEGKEATYSFEIFDRTNIDRFPRLWLASVKTLSLCHFRCTWEDLRELLTAAKNLSDLTLRYCRLETDSMIDLLEFLPLLTLKHLSLQGAWKVDDDAGIWHSHDETDFTDCVAVTTYEGPYLKRGLRSRIEEFALHGGKCPLPKWNEFANSRADLIWEQWGDTSWHYVPVNVTEW